MIHSCYINGKGGKECIIVYINEERSHIKLMSN